MTQKTVLAILLAGVLVLIAACGRGRTPVTTDTPVPTVVATGAATATLTAVPVALPTDTPEPTLAPTDEPTAEPEATEESTPGETVAASEGVTESAEITATESVTVVGRITETGIRENSEISPTLEMTTTGEVTATEVVSESAAIETPAADDVATDAVVGDQPVTLPVDLATSVTITHVRALSDLVADVLPVSAELSPDGTRVAWLVPEAARRLAHLCIAAVDGSGVGGSSEDGENCFTIEGYLGMPYRLVWSPDSQWIAFSEDPSAQALESDIWLLDVANGVVTNRSDDGAAGRYVAVDGDYALDYLPMWDAATGNLYFWRSVPDANGSFALSLMRLDVVDEGAPQTVRDFGQTLGDGLVRFGWQRFYLQGPSAIAPDGSALVVEIAPAQEMDVADSHALWLIDLANVEAEPRSLATSLDWQVALPQWSNQPAVVRGLQWTADGKGLLVAALSNDLRLPLLLPYYVDVASGEITPVLDFSESVDRAAFFRVDAASGSAPRFAVPWTIGLTPNANVALLVTDLGGATSIWGAALPPAADAPVLLAQYRSPGYEAWTRSSSGADGMVLIYGLLMQSVAE